MKTYKANDSTKMVKLQEAEDENIIVLNAEDMEKLSGIGSVVFMLDCNDDSKFRNTIFEIRIAKFVN